MAEWKDYYDILWLGPNATEETIKEAYRKRSRGTHPDRAQDTPTAKQHAEEAFKAVKEAYDVLIDPDKRRKYDAEWQEKHDQTVAHPGSPPKPEVDPPSICFTNVNAGDVQTDSFVVRNTGGPCSNIWISNPDSWLRVTAIDSLTDSDELPLAVDIEAVGSDWGKSYTEVITVKLDEEHVEVRVDLDTGRKSVFMPTRTPTPTATPSPPRRLQRALAFPMEWGGQLTGVLAAMATGILLMVVCALGGFYGLQTALIPLALALVGVSTYSVLATDWLRDTTGASMPQRIATGATVVCGWLSIASAAAYAAMWVLLAVFWIAVWVIGIGIAISIIISVLSGGK